MHGQERKASEHWPAQERISLVAGKRLVRNPAINQQGRDPVPLQTVQPVRPEIGFHQNKQTWLDSLDEQGDNRSQVNRTGDEGVNKGCKELTGHLRAGGGGHRKHDPRFRKGFPKTAYQGEGGGNLAHGKGVNPEDRCGWGTGGECRQLPGKTEAQPLQHPVAVFPAANDERQERQQQHAKQERQHGIEKSHRWCCSLAKGSETCECLPF